MKTLKLFAIDETSRKKSHTYLITVVNHKTGEVIWVHGGFDSRVLEKFCIEIGPEAAFKP